MMRWAILLLGLVVAACSSETHLQPIVRADDPTWALNPGQWASTVNNLDQAPVNAPVYAADHAP